MVQFALNRNTMGRGSVYTGSLLAAETPWIFVIEDLNLNNTRVFIDKQPYDVNSLAFLNQERFHFTNGGLFIAQDATTQATYFTNSGTMYLYNHAISTTALVEDSTAGSGYLMRGWGNMYHWNMDPTGNPVRPMISLSGGNNYFYGWGSNVAVATPPQVGGLYSTDIAAGAIAMKSLTYTFSQYGTMAGEKFLVEDTVNSVLWTKSATYGATNYIYYTTNYLTTGATGTAAVTGTAGTDYFYMGRDTANNLYFTSVAHASINDPVTVSWINASSKAVTAVLSAQVPAASNSQTYNMMFPSNIRTDSSSRKVFYTMHWDNTNGLAPLQFIWNPSLVGNISKVNCTMTYPGSNTSNNYIAHSVNTAATSTLNNVWFYRPYQFTIGTNNYITFTQNDLSAGYVNNAVTRFPNTATRTWVTYQIGSVATSNDNVLTYHSSVPFTNITDLPHSWIAVPGTSGNTLAIVNFRGINFYRFTEASGWGFQSLYPGRALGVGFDQTNRCWAYMADTPSPQAYYNNDVAGAMGAGSLHIVSPTSNSAIPTNIAIVYANTNLIYSGSNVSTSATVNAYDTSNTRMVANLTLTIDGYSMQFSNGAKSGLVTTSNSADTTINLTITGGGTSAIIPSVNI